MRRRGYIAAAVLVCAALAGCAKTPDQAVVREKGEHGVEGYQENTEGAGGTEESGADTSAAGGQENAGTGAAEGRENAGIGAGGTEAGTQKTNTLAQKLQAPERYQTSLTASDGKFKLECDADVYVPDVQKVPIYQVKQREFSQEFIDQVTTAFFGGVPVYDSDYIYGRTKAEVEEKLNEYKGYLAEGNLDPYGRIEKAKEAGAGEEELEQISHYLQDAIDEWERVYAEAPETKEKVEVQPGFSNQPENGEDSYRDNSFLGYVETEEGNYLYHLDSWTSMPMQIRVQRLYQEKDAPANCTPDWFETIGLYDEEKTDTSLTEEEQRARLGQQVGITKEEAAAMADQYVERLGLAGDFSAKNILLARGTWEGDMLADEPDFHVIGYAWQVNYTRDVDGFPVTDEMDSGGALESMESTLEPWCYERLQITVNKDGLQFAELDNLYEVGERRMENVQMLSFPEIAGIFEQMIQIQHADLSYTDELKITIPHISLGYMRIYDPSVDNRAGMLVPVWDFFGIHESTNVYEGQTYYNKEEYENRSFLTVNAADGTVIDRDLGY